MAVVLLLPERYEIINNLDVVLRGYMLQIIYSVYLSVWRVWWVLSCTLMTAFIGLKKRSMRYTRTFLFIPNSLQFPVGRQISLHRLSYFLSFLYNFCICWTWRFRTEYPWHICPWTSNSQRSVTQKKNQNYNLPYFVQRQDTRTQ